MGKRVAVIGGGLGGLASAIRLAGLGHRVTLFEKNTALGGKMNERRLAGYRFDTGPSLLTMPFVIDDLFEAVGRDRRSVLEFIPIDPICRYFYPDGTTLDAHADPARMEDALAQLSPEDARQYPRFYRAIENIYRATADVFLFTPFQEWGELLRGKHLKSLLMLPRIDAMRTVHKAVSSYFSDERIVQLFDRYATYNGSDPFRAPATLNVIPWVEYGLGGYYIRGGMYRLVEELVRLARELGVELHTEAPVDKIVHNGLRVDGIVLDGARVDVDAVVCNADVAVAHRTLIDGLPRRRQALDRLEPSLSGMVFLWGVKGRHTNLAHHNIFFSRDYRVEFQQIFQELRAPDDPTIYLAVTSQADPDHAPDGAENWFVLLNMPYLAEGQDWGRGVERMRRIVLDRFREVGLDIEGRIEVEEVIAPPDFDRLYASNRGSIYGLSSNTRAAAFQRPANRSRDLKGLYFAGGSAHPGGGIPLTLLSGRMAADLLHKHEG